MSGHYPETVIEVLDDDMGFPPAVVAACQRFAQSGPWRGSLPDRQKKFRSLLLALADAYGIAPPSLRFERMDGGFSGDSHYIPALNRIVLVGRASVVSFFHEVGHALGMNERRACTFSLNLFRRIWPEQFARLIHRGHVVVRPCDLISRESRPALAKRLPSRTESESLRKTVLDRLANSSPATVQVGGSASPGRRDKWE